MPAPVIMAVGGDPGPAATLDPVIAELVAQGWAQVGALTYRQAGGLWAQRGIGCAPLDEGLDIDQARRRLEQSAAALLLTSTSYNEVMLEGLFLQAADRLGIPSLCVLDFPSHYQARFTDAQGRRVRLPTLIAVGDEQTRAEMIAEGFPPQGLAVTGLPAMDHLARFRSSFGPSERRRARQALGAGPSDILVLFASQPLKDFFQIRPGALGALGYDEGLVLGLVIQALEALAAEGERGMHLVIRPHPREDPARLARVISRRIAVAVDDSIPAPEAVCAADLVVGMNSMLLMEACYLGAVTMSVQPGLSLPETLPTNRLGLSNPVYDQADLLPALRRLLWDDQARAEAKARLANLATDGQAAARVVALAARLLGRA